MKRNIPELLRKIQLLMAAAFAVYPVYWILSAWSGSARVSITWIFSMGAVVMGTISFFVPGKLRVAYGAAVCLCAAGGVIFAAPADIRTGMLLQSLLFSGQLLWSLQVASWDRETEIPGFWISIGIAAHLAGQIFLLTDWAKEYPTLLLRLSLYAFVLLTMLSSNRKSLLTASGKSGRVPAALSRRNILLILALFALALAGALIPSAFALIKGLLSRLMQWILQLIENMRAPLRETEQSPDTANQAAEILSGGERQLGLSPLLETVILYAGAAISGLLLLWIVYRAGRKLLKALAEGWRLLSRSVSSASEDYVDEISDTREGGNAEVVRAGSRLRRISGENKSLAPGERIRAHYLRLLLRHPEWSPGATAREKLPEEAASLYELARYSAHSVSEEDARAFSQAARKL